MNQQESSKANTDRMIALAFCIAVLAMWVLKFLFSTDKDTASPQWLQPAAALVGAMGLFQMNGPAPWEYARKVMIMTGLLLMVWSASGLLFDFLKMAGLIGDPATGKIATVDWPGTVSRALALASAVFLTRIVLTTSAADSSPANWYGYAAFILALPYPVFRIVWAFGGTPGITHPGAAGEGFSPLIIAIPWMLAAGLSLLLVSPRKWKPRRLLLAAGWTATAIVACVGPAGLWTIVSSIIKGEIVEGEIAVWVFILFYGSWFLWAIAAFATTRSYQLRSREFAVTKGLEK